MSIMPSIFVSITFKVCKLYVRTGNIYWLNLLVLSDFLVYKEILNIHATLLVSIFSP